MSWEISSEELADFREAFDAFITNWGKDCRLHYPPRRMSCANCLPGLGGTSSNHYRSGGPMPFPNGSTCPLCTGTGKREEEVTETVRMMVAFTSENFFVPMPNVPVRTAYSLCQTKGYLSDLPKLQKCDYLVVETAVEGITRLKYKMIGEGLSKHNIIQARYVVCLWERI